MNGSSFQRHNLPRRPGTTCSAGGLAYQRHLGRRLLRGSRFAGSNETTLFAFLDFKSVLITETSEGAVNVDFGEAVARAGSLADELEQVSLERRILEALAARGDDPTKALAWLVEFEARFEILLKRAVRVRNVITHGGLTTPEITESVITLLATLEINVLGARQYALVPCDAGSRRLHVQLRAAKTVRRPGCVARARELATVLLLLQTRQALGSHLEQAELL